MQNKFQLCVNSIFLLLLVNVSACVTVNNNTPINYKAQNTSNNYLLENAKKPNVQITDSGLQYRILRQGSGKKPKLNSKVVVHYRGLFPNGMEFDSSYKHNKPATFTVRNVIKGWTEGLLLMNQGSVYELLIPSELAYGKRGAGKVIPPNQVLKFQIELIAIR